MGVGSVRGERAWASDTSIRPNGSRTLTETPAESMASEPRERRSVCVLRGE